MGRQQFALIGGSLVALCAQTVSAQTTTAATPAAGAQGPAPRSTPDATTDAAPGDVIVTAQRREERLRDVPLSVAVTSGAELRHLQLDSLTDLRYTIPGFSFTDKAKLSNQGPSIRGVGTVALLSNGVEQSVGTVIDGVVIGRANGSAGDLTDVERVEVLRGPQGTLFGKNSSAGVINIITRNPVFEDSVEANVTAASYRDFRVDATANVRLTDTVAARLNVFSFRRDGTVLNLFNGNRVNDRDTYGFRGKVLYRPDDRLDILFVGDYTRRDDTCCNFVTRKQAAAGFFKAAGDPILGSTTNTTGNFDADIHTRYTNIGLAGTINYDLGGFTLTSITAHRYFNSNDNMDSDGTFTPIVDRNNNRYTWTQNSQELRLTSDAARRLAFVFGLFYFEQRFDVTTLQRGTLGQPVTTFYAQQFRELVRSKSYAVFGQATLKLTDHFRLIGGLRYTHETYRDDFNRQFLPGFLNWPGVAAVSPSGGATLDNWSYRAGAQFDVTSGIMAYATYSTGYKGPALNPFLNTILVTQPETTRAVEAGIKTALFDNRLAFNLAVFDQRINGFQAPVADYTIVPPVVRIINAGAARTRGVEADATWRAARGLTLSGGLSYADATFLQFGKIACYFGQTAAQGCIGGLFDPSGQDLPNAPKLTTNATARYETDIPGTAVGGFVQANYVYKDRVNFLFNSDPNTVQPGYGLFNLTTGVRSQDGRWELTLFARNLFDKKFVVGAAPSGLDGAGGHFQYVSPDARRTFGITFHGKL